VARRSARCTTNIQLSYKNLNLIICHTNKAAERTDERWMMEIGDWRWGLPLKLAFRRWKDGVWGLAKEPTLGHRICHSHSHSHPRSQSHLQFGKRVQRRYDDNDLWWPVFLHLGAAPSTEHRAPSKGKKHRNQKANCKKQEHEQPSKRATRQQAGRQHAFFMN